MARTSAGAAIGRLGAAVKHWFGSDVNLYRGGADILKTDDNLEVNNGYLFVGTSSGAKDTASPISSRGSYSTFSQFSGVTHRMVQNSVVYRGGASATGTLKLTMPFSWSNDMLRFTVSGFNHSATSGHWDVEVAGYSYASNQEWSNPTYRVTGRPPFTKVRLGHDGTKCCLLLGETTTNWNYPNFTVKDLQCQDAGWGAGWTVSFITDETGITASVPTLGYQSVHRGLPNPKTSNHTLSIANDIVVSNGSNLTMTLPDAATIENGRQFVIKNIHSTNCTVASLGGTIDGAATVTLAQWDSITVVAYSGAWYSIVEPVAAAGSSTQTFDFTGSFGGQLATLTGTQRFYNDTGKALTITGIRATVGTTPSTSSVIVDVNKNGTTLFTTQANRPTIAVGSNTTGKLTNMDVTSFANGDYLTFDVDQVGSTSNPGANLVITVIATG